MERPLSTYLIISIILSAIQIYLCVQSMDETCKFAADATIGHSTWVLIELAFAVINVIFAFYFQHKVWNHILARKDEFMNGIAQDTKGGGMLGGLRGGVQNVRGQLGGTQNATTIEEPPYKKSKKIKVKSESVQSSFKEVFLQDFGVLFYFFGLIAIMVVSYIGLGSVEANKDICKNEEFVSGLGIAFFWIAFIYTLFWYCCKCCAGTVTLERDEEEMF